jgi:hypothetical protein
MSGRERGIIAFLRKIAEDPAQPERIRAEAREALRNHERLSGKEPEQK